MGPVTLGLLFGTHLFLTFRLRFVQRYILQAIGLSFATKRESKGDISHFGALTTAIAATVGTGNIVGVATAVRTVVILLIAWGIVFAKNGTPGLAALSKSSFVFLCLSGIATGLSWIMYFKALQLGKVAQVASIDKLSIVIAIVLAALFLRETIPLKTLFGALLMMAGALVIIF